ILSGVAEANPWVELFERKLNFQFTIDEATRKFRVVNRNPLPQENAAYFNSPEDPTHRAYGLLAFQPGLAGEDVVLIIEGTTMAGTDAAADFALTDGELLPVLRRMSNGKDRMPFFEILLETTNMDGQAPRSQVVAVRETR